MSATFRVAMPTIAQRCESRQLTCEQVAQVMGRDRMTVIEQDERLPLGPASQWDTAARAIREALNHADNILYLEDDIDIDPLLWAQASADLSAGRSVSYWHPRSRHGCKPGRMVGALAVGLTGAAARRLLDNGAPDHGGIDIAMRSVVDAVHPKALVEHRPGRRFATRTPQILVTSDCYEGPHCDDLADRIVAWLPGRPDRHRVTTHALAAAVLEAPERVVAAVIRSLIVTGRVQTDGTHLWAPRPRSIRDDKDGQDSQETLC